MKQYYVKYWGEAEGFLKDKLGVTELDFWFNTEKERLVHVRNVKSLCNGVGRIISAFQEGEELEYKTVVEMNLVYKDKSYPKHLFLFLFHQNKTMNHNIPLQYKEPFYLSYQ